MDVKPYRTPTQLPKGLAPITGFELRARCCGAVNRFELPHPTQSEEAA